MIIYKPYSAYADAYIFIKQVQGKEPLAALLWTDDIEAIFEAWCLPPNKHDDSLRKNANGDWDTFYSNDNYLFTEEELQAIDRHITTSQLWK